MAEAKEQVEAGGSEAAVAPVIHVSPSPHVVDRALTTRRMMVDVLIALVPVVAASLWIFGPYAAKQIVLCVVTCVATEVLLTLARRRRVTITDCSAAVTGVILAMSLPGPAPWYVAVIGSVVAIGIGKVLFGGLGQNIFNPAMVGRAFVMLAFAEAMGSSGYVVAKGGLVNAVTSATPMTLARHGVFTPLLSLLIGHTNGSLGETSAIACLLGGLYLVIRRTASWEIPAGVLGAVATIGALVHAFNPAVSFTVLDHLLGGALLFGAFFIATDLVTSPLTPRGKFIFGLGVGALVMVVRTLSNYPEGVMFAVLLMNALVPLINRWTIPTPVGGPVPARK